MSQHAPSKPQQRVASKTHTVPLSSQAQYTYSAFVKDSIRTVHAYTFAYIQDGHTTCLQMQLQHTAMDFNFYCNMCAT